MNNIIQALFNDNLEEISLLLNEENIKSIEPISGYDVISFVIARKEAAKKIRNFIIDHYYTEDYLLNKTAKNVNPLHLSALHSNEKELKKILSIYIKDINTKFDNKTPLENAIFSKNKNIPKFNNKVKLLLNSGSDLNLNNIPYKVLKSKISINEGRDWFELFSSYNINYNFKDSNGNNYLHLYLKMSQNNILNDVFVNKAILSGLNIYEYNDKKENCLNILKKEEDKKYLTSLYIEYEKLKIKDNLNTVENNLKLKRNRL